MKRSRQLAVLRRIVERISPGAVVRYRALRGRYRALRYGYRETAPTVGSTNSTTAERRHVFAQAFQTGVWSGTGESRSGDGSSMAYTAELRRALPNTLRDLGIRSMLDVPCGDWNWMSQVDLPVEKYIGGDIVPSIVAQNRARFATERIDFRVIDLCVDSLPAADLLLCRDALVHFSNADIRRAIDNILEAEIEFLATTTFPEATQNLDIATGIPWRAINLEAAPFCFPPPISSLPEGSPERCLGIWRLSELRSAERVSVLHERPDHA